MNGIYKSYLYIASAFIIVLLSGSCSDNTVTDTVKVETRTVLEVTGSSAIASGRIISAEDVSISERGVVVSETASPEYETGTIYKSGSGTGEFICRLTGLSPETVYHYRAYAFSSDKVFYGEEKTLETTASGIPQVGNVGITKTLPYSVEVSCEVSDDNGYRILDRGFVWSRTEDPTLEVNDGKVTAGRGTGTWSSSVSPLSYNTEYKVRAYATTSEGTGYSESVVVKTALPSVLNVNINGVVLKMVLVEGGSFMMGGTEEQGDDAEKVETPVHKVNLDSYYISFCEVTKEIWTVVMEGRQPGLTDTERYYPAATMSWVEAQTFLEKLNQMTSMRFSLPTEAQWEYAARGGNKSKNYKYSGGNTANLVSWNYSNAKSNVQVVATRQPNELGLYDMSGNVLEWCSDWYGYYSEEEQTNPKGPDSGTTRVMRGGSVINDAVKVRTTSRFGGEPNSHFYFVGLRLVLNVD